MESIREKIIIQYSNWTAFSATRSGCPMKSRKTIYPLLEKVNFLEIMKGNEIQADEFDKWHEKSVKLISRESGNVLSIGWSAKLINVFLKTAIYVGNLGRKNLIQLIHPPIDQGLWDGISEYLLPKNSEILKKNHIVTKIKDIQDYKTYKVIIDGFSELAKQENCLLFEVEQFWKGTLF
ncbi:MAG: hypothetical protein L6Q54_03510 [Leptospiraceae bacterium]|nr:hypothetical protein [Leptospiraceae bacterium]